MKPTVAYTLYLPLDTIRLFVVLLTNVMVLYILGNWKCAIDKKTFSFSFDCIKDDPTPLAWAATQLTDDFIANSINIAECFSTYINIIFSPTMSNNSNHFIAFSNPPHFSVFQHQLPTAQPTNRFVQSMLALQSVSQLISISNCEFPNAWQGSILIDNEHG